MNFRDIISNTASLVCLLVIFNVVVHKAMGKHLNDSYKLYKYKNLLQTTREMNEIAYETIEDFKSKSLFGYNDQKKRSALVCNVTYTNINNLTEKDKLIQNEKELIVFLKPLNKVIADIKKQQNVKHSLNDLQLLRHKVVDLILTIRYVESHLHYDISNSNQTKTGQPSAPLYQMSSNISLGNRVVSLLQCLEKELFFSGRFYHDKVKELKNTKSTVRK